MQCCLKRGAFLPPKCTKEGNSEGKGSVILNIHGNSSLGSWRTQTGCLDLNLCSYGRFCAVLSPLSQSSRYSAFTGHLILTVKADSVSFHGLFSVTCCLSAISSYCPRALRWIPSFASRKVSLLSNPRRAFFPINYWLVPRPGAACHVKKF